MTAMTLPKAGNGLWERVLYHLVILPAYSFMKHGNQALITFASCYASAQFSMQHAIFPWWVAIPLAAGFEWTYLSGIILAGATRKGFWVMTINIWAMLTSVIFGMLFVLGKYDMFPEQPEGVLAVVLAAAHIVPITVMSLLYALAQRAYSKQEREDADKVAEQAKQLDDEQRLREEQQRAREDRWRDEQLVIEIQRKQLALERERVALERERSQAVAPLVAPETASIAPVPSTKPCPKCGRPLSPQQYSNACRRDRGYCRSCKDE
jgi:hypothetical protein